jgi:hypothetical protein
MTTLTQIFAAFADQIREYRDVLVISLAALYVILVLMIWGLVKEARRG